MDRATEEIICDLQAQVYTLRVGLRALARTHPDPNALLMAWREALEEKGLPNANARIHRLVGMGGKLLLRTLFIENGIRVSSARIEQLEKLRAIYPDKELAQALDELIVHKKQEKHIVDNIENYLALTKKPDGSSAI